MSKVSIRSERTTAPPEEEGKSADAGLESTSPLGEAAGIVQGSSEASWPKPAQLLARHVKQVGKCCKKK